MTIFRILSLFGFAATFLFVSAAIGQTPENQPASVKLTLPKRKEIDRIEITGGYPKWFTPEQLLRLLTKFKPVPGTYLTKQPFEYGTFILKNGKAIKWMANYHDSILLMDGGQEQLFVIPPGARGVRSLK